MRKAVVATVAVVVVAAGAVTGVAAWSGKTVTARLEQQTADLQKALPALKVVDLKLERGLFSSTRTFTLRLGCLPPDAALPGSEAKPQTPTPLEVRWRDVVHHGPFPAGSGLGFASIDSELISPDAWKDKIAQLTGQRPLLSVHTAIDLSGAMVSDVTVPALHYEDPANGKLSTTALRATVHSKAASDPKAGSAYTTDGQPFELSVLANDGTSMTLKLSATHGKTEVAPRADASLWFTPTKSSGRADSLELTGTAAKGLPIQPVATKLSDLSFEFDSKLQNGLFFSTSRMTAKGQVNQVKLDKLELQSSIKRFHSATYQKLIASLFGNVLSCDPAAQQAAADGMLDTLQQELAGLLVHDPEYSLDNLAVELGGKRAELSYSFGTEGIKPADLSLPLPALLLTKGYVRAAAKVDNALIALLLKQVGGLDPMAAAAAGLPVGPGAADQTAALVATMTDQFVQLGYLEREGDAIKASASFESGSVLVNGKPISLPDFGALAK